MSSDQQHTALGSALSSAGFQPRDFKLGAAVQEFIKSGGTVEKAHEIVDAAAKRMPGTSQIVLADNGHHVSAQTRQPVEDERGQNHDSENGQPSLASSSSSNRGGAGHAYAAQSSQSLGAAPVREPTTQQRVTSAAIAKAAAVTVMDTLKIDGRSVGDWTVTEARRAGRLKSREGYILIEAARVVANAPGNATLRSVVKEAEMQKIIQRAAEVADAV
jgi:hypothetical protein